MKILSLVSNNEINIFLYLNIKSLLLLLVISFNILKYYISLLNIITFGYSIIYFSLNMIL